MCSYEEAIVEDEFDLSEAETTELQDDALEYLAGYIIKKLGAYEYTATTNTYNFIDEVSKGGLQKPTKEFFEKLRHLETIFNKFNYDKICLEPNIRQKLIQKSYNVDIPIDVKSFFFKCRIFFRVKHLNKCLKIQKSKQKLFGLKNMLKTTT